MVSLAQAVQRAVVETSGGTPEALEASHDLLTPMSLASREERVRTKAAKLIGGATADEVWALLRTGGRAADFANRLGG